MALGRIDLSLDASEITQLRDALGNLFDNKGLARTLQEALKKAIKPAEQRLKQITPEGPTGNLKRAVASKTKAYEKDGTAVGLVGYVQSTREPSTAVAGAGSVRRGKNRGFHQWWLEFGTQERFITKISNTPYGRRGHLRRVPGRPAVEVRPHIVKAGQNAVIASSFNKRGPVFNSDGSKTPYSFFKKAKKGESFISVKSMPAGGTPRLPPVRTALEQSQPQITQILQQELRISLERALNTITFASTGTVGGTVI